MRKILYFSFLFLLGLLIFGCNEETKTGDPVVEPTPEKTPEEVKYVVTFDVDCVLTTAEVLDGEKISKPLDPVKDGYIFTGWYIGEEEFNFETIVTSDITLVAMFKKANKVITKIEAASSIYNAFKGEGSLADISNKGYIYYDNTKEEISINWDYSLIDLNKEGAYSLKGSIDIPNGYELDSNIANEVYMDINIKPERKVIKEIYELDKFECFMAEKTIEDLPLTCEVLLSDGTKEEILCIWDYRTVNLTEAGEYLLEGKINIPYGYKLDSLVENYVSLDVVIKDYGFYIKEDYKKSREEYYARDTISLVLTDDNGIMDGMDYEDIKNIEWTVDNETKAVRSIEQRYLTVIVLDFVEEINIYASFIYRGIEFKTEEIYFEVSHYDAKEKDEDVITVLCDKDDLKYLDPFASDYVYDDGEYSPGIKNPQYVLCAKMYKDYSNIKFMVYPDEINTMEEKAEYIIGKYNSKTALFDVVFMSSRMIGLIMKKDEGVLWQLPSKTIIEEDGGNFQKQITSYKGIEYGRIFFPEHPLGMIENGMFYNTADLERYGIDDPAEYSSSWDEFESWVDKVVQVLPSGVSLIEEDKSKFTEYLLKRIAGKTYLESRDFTKEVNEFYQRLESIGAFGEKGILRFEKEDSDSFIYMPSRESAFYMYPKRETMVFCYLNPNGEYEPSRRMFIAAEIVDEVLNMRVYVHHTKGFAGIMRIYSDSVRGEIYEEVYGITNILSHKNLAYDEVHCNGYFVYDE